MSLRQSEASATTLTVAAFDFDGTVTNGGSVLPFLVFVRGLRPVMAAVVATLPALLQGAVAGGRAADEAKEAVFSRVLAGLAERDVAAAGRLFAERHLRRHLRPTVAARLAWHRQQGHRVVLVSASPELYVRVAGDILGVDAVMATRLAVDDGGRLSGRYQGRNCRGEEKRRRLMEWMEAEVRRADGDHREDGARRRPTVWAYGNSRGDLKLLRAADHGVDVGQLGALGRLRSFPSLAEVVGDTCP